MKIAFLSVSPSFERSAALRQLAIGQHCDLMCQKSLNSKSNIGIISLNLCILQHSSVFKPVLVGTFSCWLISIRRVLAKVGFPEQKRAETQRQSSMGGSNQTYVGARERRHKLSSVCLSKYFVN